MAMWETPQLNGGFSVKSCGGLSNALFDCWRVILSNSIGVAPPQTWPCFRYATSLKPRHSLYFGQPRRFFLEQQAALQGLQKEMIS